MRYQTVMLMLCLAAGCSTAPKPAECKGEFRPVNVVEQKNASMDGTGMIVRCGKGDTHGSQG